MARVRRLADTVATGLINVVIQGETGVGKEVLAKRIHEGSRRKDKPYLRINCAAFPESMVEAELFGYERGSFTGANQSKPGLLESANGGTVLMDEVAELPLGTQAKLLRAIGGNEVFRIGSLKPRPIDVRFLAATNEPIDGLIASGRFRADLYYRLNGVTLYIPPLRERLEELDDLANLFREAAAKKFAKDPAPAFSAAALEWLRIQPWPGNIRQLLSTVEKAVLLSTGDLVEPTHLMTDGMPLGEPGMHGPGGHHFGAAPPTQPMMPAPGAVGAGGPLGTPGGPHRAGHTGVTGGQAPGDAARTAVGPHAGAPGQAAGSSMTPYGRRSSDGGTGMPGSGAGVSQTAAVAGMPPLPGSVSGAVPGAVPAFQFIGKLPRCGARRWGAFRAPRSRGFGRDGFACGHAWSRPRKCSGTRFGYVPRGHPRGGPGEAAPGNRGFLARRGLPTAAVPVPLI